MMKKLFLAASLTFLFSIVSFPVLAMVSNDEKFDIRAITPIKKDMNSEQRKEAIHSFLKDSLNPECEIKKEEIASREFRVCGVRGCLFYTLHDKSEWIQGAGGLERFFGHLYLKKAIEHYDLKTLRVAETRFLYMNTKNDDISISIHTQGQMRLKNIPVIDSEDFITFSRYVGDERIKEVTSREEEELEVLRSKIGFTDTMFYANLRRKDEKIYVIDTEYGSFSNPNDSYFEGKGYLPLTFSRSLLKE